MSSTVYTYGGTPVQEGDEIDGIGKLEQIAVYSEDFRIIPEGRVRRPDGKYQTVYLEIQQPPPPPKPASWTKLRSGDFGVRIPKGGHRHQGGDTVTVRARSGRESEVTLAETVAVYDDAIVYSIKERDRSATVQQRSEIQVEEGMYEREGEVYRVQKSRESGRLYAKRLVILSDAAQDRVSEEGQAVRHRFEYDSGAVYKLEPKDQMTLERGKALAVQYGFCIRCGAYLEAKKSVEEGIGPVCRKAFV